MYEVNQTMVLRSHGEAVVLESACVELHLNNAASITPFSAAVRSAGKAGNFQCNYPGQAGQI